MTPLVIHDPAAAGSSRRPAAALGMPLLAALFPRTYLDPNRHEGDIDLDLIEGGG